MMLMGDDDEVMKVDACDEMCDERECLPFAEPSKGWSFSGRGREIEIATGPRRRRLDLFLGQGEACSRGFALKC